ncbi:MAG: hypothetical protein IKH51_05025 [Clostridia bacterium]|jgi:hypothetical protein|nr:hypothetical protein [Clostridia bacterium]
MKKEKLFVIVAAVCIFAIALFMIGGVVQDIDYHTLSSLPLLEQKAAYDDLQTRKTVGEIMQLVGALLALAGFAAITVVALTVGQNSAEEAEKRYGKSE